MQLEETLQVKRPAKVQNNFNTNKLNLKIMIKLPKKIVRTIQNELGTTDITFIEDVYIHHIYKPLCVHLIALRIRQSKYMTLVRYFDDNSYSICGMYDHNEIVEEIKLQVKKLW